MLHYQSIVIAPLNYPLKIFINIGLNKNIIFPPMKSTYFIFKQSTFVEQTRRLLIFPCAPDQYMLIPWFFWLVFFFVSVYVFKDNAHYLTQQKKKKKSISKCAGVSTCCSLSFPSVLLPPSQCNCSTLPSLLSRGLETEVTILSLLTSDMHADC